MRIIKIRNRLTMPSITNDIHPTNDGYYVITALVMRLHASRIYIATIVATSPGLCGRRRSLYCLSVTNFHSNATIKHFSRSDLEHHSPVSSFKPCHVCIYWIALDEHSLMTTQPLRKNLVLSVCCQCVVIVLSVYCQCVVRSDNRLAI